MKTDKLLKLIQQKKAMRSGGALPLPKAQVGRKVILTANPTPSLEKQINKELGYPMRKAAEAADSGEKWFNPKTKKWEKEDPVDNLRHAMAGKYTAEAIADKFPGWMQYTPIAKTVGFLGANVLGIGHELTAINKNPNYSWWDKTREAGEDIFNNLVGATAGSLPLSNEQKENILFELSRKNLLPDGYGKGNMYFKEKGGLAKAQKGLQFVPNGTYGNYYDPSTGQYIPQVYLPDVNIVADKSLPFQNGKFAPFLAAKGMVENDALSDPIALAAALTAGGVGLGTIGLSQIPRVFARNLASEATAGVSDFVRNKLAKTASQLDLEELRRVYHNSERFLQPDEARYLFKHGHGLREDYITDRPGYFDWGTDRWNAASQSSPLPSSEQLPPPPEDIWGVAEGPSTSANTFNLNLLQTSDEPKKVFNRSGLTKDEVLQKASAKDKNAVSEMSETEFENTVLKPDGEIVEYRPGPSIDQMTYDPKTRKMVLRDQTILSEKEYADEFNSQLDLLNEIIAQKNKTGVEYKVKSLDPYGNLIFETPSQGNIERNWAVKINPGKWRGDVEDIVNTEYYRSVPGLEMSNTAIPVFGDMQPRRGSGTYEAINEYLKRLDLGRVKAGFNSQTDLSRGAWENFIKSGRGFGFYANPRTVHGIMKTIVPGAIGAGALQQIEEQQIGGSSNMKTDKLLQLITNANPRFQKGGGLNNLVVSEMWEKLTGTKWSQAKKLGLTDGSYEKNLQLRNMLAEEAAKPKPNMGKFTGRGTPQVPKASAATRNLTAAALQQTATPRASTAVNMPVVSAPMAPVPKKPGSRPAMTKEQMAQALDQARGINPAAQSTLTVAQPVIQTPVGRMPMPAEKPVLVPVTPPMGQPTYPQQAEESGSMFPNLSRMATASMLNILPVVSGVQAANLYGPMMIGNKTYEATDKALNVLPSFIGNYTRGLLGWPITEENFTDEELRALGHAIREGEKKGYGVPKNYKDLGYTGSFGYDDYPGRRDAINAFTGLTSPQYWGDGKMGNRLKRIAKGWDDLNAAYSVGMGNFKKNPDGSYTVGDDYNFNRDYVKDNPTSLAERMEKIGFISGAEAPTTINIPAEYVKKSGGAKRSLKIRIRKNG